MRLHEDKEAFTQIVEVVAEDIGLMPFQIEKDYYVSMMLREISKIKDISIVFKGGTSLSKCYDIIDRFSEDIDLSVNFEGHKLNDRKRKKLKVEIKKIINKFDFDFLNEVSVQSDRDYNKYEIGYQKLFQANDTMVDHIIIETIVVYKPYPCEKYLVSNYILKYLEKNKQISIIKDYELEPFEMMIQTIDRTFIDKIFATCDYHLQKNYLRHSRHLYDLHQIWGSNLLNLSNVIKIMNDVVKDRQINGTQNLSCMPGKKPKSILKEVCDQNVYEKDYRDITSAFIYKHVDYEKVIETIKKIYESNLMPEVIDDYRN